MAKFIKPELIIESKSCLYLQFAYCNDKHERLKELAKAKGISVNKLIEDLSTIALTEFDAETRFCAMASQGNVEEGLAILNKLDSYFNAE